MLDPKYNEFILLWITDNLDYLTRGGLLHYKVPFGNYGVGQQVDDNFDNLLIKYLKDYNMCTVQRNLIGFEYDAKFDCVFSYDGSYYKVVLFYNVEEGWDLEPYWLDENLEKYQVYPKKKMITVYE